MLALSFAFTEPCVWFYWKAEPSTLTRRAFVIETPSARRFDNERSATSWIQRNALVYPQMCFWQSHKLLQSILSCAWFRTDVILRKSRAFHHALTSAPKKCMLLKIDLVFDNCQQNRSVKHKNCIFSKNFHENILLVRKKAVPLHSLSKTKGVKLTNWVDFEEQKVAHWQTGTRLETRQGSEVDDPPQTNMICQDKRNVNSAHI